MIRHSLRRVRMNPADMTLHCVTHGLLPDDEARDVLARSHLEAAPFLDAAGRLGWLARAFDWIVFRLPARCTT